MTKRNSGMPRSFITLVLDPLPYVGKQGRQADAGDGAVLKPRVGFIQDEEAYHD